MNPIWLIKQVLHLLYGSYAQEHIFFLKVTGVDKLQSFSVNLD